MLLNHIRVISKSKDPFYSGKGWGAFPEKGFLFKQGNIRYEYCHNWGAIAYIARCNTGIKSILI